MTTELSLLQRLQQSEPAAWLQVVANWTPDLYTYLTYTMPLGTTAERLVNEVFQTFVEKIATFTPQISLTTYLYSIAYYKVADAWRRTVASDTYSPMVYDATMFNLPRELAEPLAELPELAQQVLFLRYQARLPFPVLAEVLGRSLKATDSLLSRILSQFSLAFDKQGQRLSDEEMAALFQRKAPRLLLPEGVLERIQQQVLTYLGQK